MGRSKGRITPKGVPTSASALLTAIAQSSNSTDSNVSGSPKLARGRRLSTRSSSDDSLLSGSSLSTNQVVGHAQEVQTDAGSSSAYSNRHNQKHGFPSLDPPLDARTQTPARSFDVDPTWIPYPEDKDCLKHGEFGFCEDQEYRYTSQWRGWEQDNLHVVEEEPKLITYLTTYLSYIILIIIGHVRDFFGKRFRKDSYKHLMEQEVRAPRLFQNQNPIYALSV